MKMKKLEWEEKIINEYYTDKKYTSKQGYYPCIYVTLKDVRKTLREEGKLD